MAPGSELEPPLLIITSRALRLVAGLGTAPGSLSGATVVVLGGPPPADPAWRTLRSVPAVNCTRLEAVRDARGALSKYPGRSVVLYDQEAWDLTPQHERRDPAAYVRRAAEELRGTAISLAAAPSLTLAEAVAPSGSPEAAYFASGVVEAMSSWCQVMHVQSQRLERSPQRYAAFVTEAARRSRLANPSVLITAGLSTNPPGQPVTLGQLQACVAATHPAVDGYWLNVPRPGRRCPHCNPENPTLAAALIESPAGQGAVVGLDRLDHRLNERS